MAHIVDLFVLFFLHVGTRRVFVAGITTSPNSEWVTRQARNASMQMANWNLPAKFLLIDHDSNFTDDFDSVFEADGTEVMRVGPMAPNLNAYAERFAQTLRRECLDHFIVLGESHLRHITKEFVSHYNEERPHQGKDNVPLPDADRNEPTTLPFPTSEIHCKERLGGLLKHYHRSAA